MDKNYNCDALKRLARQAKNRLSKRNYYNGKGECCVRNMGFFADYKLVLLNSKEDEKLYLKVKEILTENEDAINPIGKLVDAQKFSSLSEQDKEKYLFNLVDKYKKMKERFSKEKELSNVC